MNASTVSSFQFFFADWQKSKVPQESNPQTLLHVL